ncbi:uncharacterized protein BDV14DRAFT_184976 [Aspergillus stella-maris]|uniref:uncharacterized protein n=1 Tax=Aspergillus stella-maris TaxID=1810926 RepID=UPI003CCCD3A3
MANIPFSPEFSISLPSPTPPTPEAAPTTPKTTTATQTQTLLSAFPLRTLLITLLFRILNIVLKTILHLVSLTIWIFSPVLIRILVVAVMMRKLLGLVMSRECGL